MKLSMIMTTQGNREAEFTRLVGSLLKQKNIDLELIIIDQSSSNNIKSIIDNIQFPFEIIYIKTNNKISISKARNIGLKRIHGDIVCFPDDDCWYEDNSLEKIIYKFKIFKDVDIFCFNVFDPLTGSYYGRYRSRQKREKIINLFNIFKIPISISIFIKVKNNEDIIFDESLGAGCLWGSGEETDLLIRLYNKSYKICFNNDINIYHPIMHFNKNDIDKMYKYGLGFGATIAKSVRGNIKNKLLYYEFFGIIIKSMLGMIVNIWNKNKYHIYKKRMIGIIEGYRQYANECKISSEEILS